MTANVSSKKTVALWGLVCFFAPIGMLLVVSYLCNVYPFGSESFLTEDLKYQYIDFFTWYRSVLTGKTSLFYSLTQGLGSNTWGLYSYYLASPFNFLILLYPQDKLTDAIYVICALKLGCMGVSADFYFRRRFGLGHVEGFLLSLSYTGSTWVFTNVRNPLWLDAVILLPCVAYAAWRFIHTDAWKLLCGLLTVSIIVCWYTAWMTILFTGLYLIFELYLYHVDVSQITPVVVRHKVVRFIGVLTLAVLLSAWTFFPTVLAFVG